MKEEGDILRCLVEVLEEERASMYLDSCFLSSPSFLHFLFSLETFVEYYHVDLTSSCLSVTMGA